MPKRSRLRHAAVAVGAAAALGAGVITTLGPGASFASSHREAPLVAADPQIDNTDVYAFVSPDKPNTTTLVSLWNPFEYPAGGPNFYSFAPGVHYDVNVDNNGNGVADITFRWTFTNHYRNPDTFLYNTGQVTSLDDTDLNFYQTYDLQKVTKNGTTTTMVSDAVAAPSFVGDVSMPDYPGLMKAAEYKAGPNGRTYAGQSDDPFFLDLRVFDLLYGADLGWPHGCLFKEGCNDSDPPLPWFGLAGPRTAWPAERETRKKRGGRRGLRPPHGPRRHHPGAGGGPCPAARRSSGLAEKGDASPPSLRHPDAAGSVLKTNFSVGRRNARTGAGDAARRRSAARDAQRSDSATRSSDGRALPSPGSSVIRT